MPELLKLLMNSIGVDLMSAKDALTQGSHLGVAAYHVHGRILSAHVHSCVSCHTYLVFVLCISPLSGTLNTLF